MENISSKKELKWFHGIGACGKATAPITKMFKDMGWFVTGTDAQFSPPASDILVENNIPFALDYHYSHMTKQFWEAKLKEDNWEKDNAKYWKSGQLNIPNKPDLALIVESATPKNKEYMYAKVQGIDVRPYSQILGEYLVKPESVVVVGTAGKTTTTALIVHVLKGLGLEPSYMVGADVVGFENAVENTASNYSVLEGDEYHHKELANGAKFLEYKPKYLVVTNVGWEHQEIFPTQDEYIEEFRKVVQLVPEDGLIVAKLEDANITKILKDARCRVVRYKTGKTSDHETDEFGNPVFSIYHYEDEADNTLVYSIYNNSGETLAHGTSNLIGQYNFENILSAFLIVNNISGAQEKIKAHQFANIFELQVKEFKGVTKRLEKVYENENITIIDDFGIAPNRAKNSLKTLRDYYPEHEITAVFEPNAGSRPNEEQLFKQFYTGAFENAHEVIVPELSEFNKEIVGTEQFIAWLKDLGVNVKHLKKEEINPYLKSKIENEKSKILLVFFSAYRLTDTVHELAKSIPNSGFSPRS